MSDHVLTARCGAPASPYVGSAILLHVVVGRVARRQVVKRASPRCRGGHIARGCTPLAHHQRAWIAARNLAL